MFRAEHSASEEMLARAMLSCSADCEHKFSIY